MPTDATVARLARWEEQDSPLADEQTAPREPVQGRVTDQGPDRHVLKLGNEEFPCKADLKLGFLVRSAKNGLEGLHDILIKAVPEEFHDEMFDITDGMDLEEIGDAVGQLVESYSNERPTARSSSSRGGSRNTEQR